VPLVAPATSLKRLAALAPIADSFIYVVSKMGVTGSAANTTMSDLLPGLCARVRKYAKDTPIAVGFGVNTRDHFLSVGPMSDGIVIGSKIVSVLKQASPGTAEAAVREYCKEVSRPRTEHEQNGSHDIGLGESIDMAKVEIEATPTATIHRTKNDASNGLVDQLESLKGLSVNGNLNKGNKSFEVESCSMHLNISNCRLDLASLEVNMSPNLFSTVSSSLKKLLSLPSTIRPFGKSFDRIILI